MKKKINSSPEKLKELRRKAITRFKKLKNEKPLPKTKADLIKLVKELQQKLNTILVDTDSSKHRLNRQELTKAIDYLDYTLDGLLESVVLIDEEGEILAVNRAWKEFAENNGASMETVLVGANYFNACKNKSGEWKDDAKAFGEGIKKIITRELDTFELEYPCHSPNKLRWFLEKVTRYQRKGNSYIVISHENITERKQAEEALNESEERFRRLFDEPTDPILLLNDRMFFDCNPAALSILQLQSKDDLLNKSPWDLSPEFQPDGKLSSEKALEMMAEARQKGFHRFEWVHTKKDLSNFYVEVMLTTITLNNKEIYHVIWRDITDRKKAEEELRESENKYRRLHESMTDSFVSVEMNGQIEDFNQAYIDMLGYTEAEIKKLTYVDLTPVKWHDLEAKIVAEQILPKGYSDVYQKEYRKKDGTVFPIELRTFLIKDVAGKPSAMWAIIRDITERKRTEQEIIDSQVRLRALAARLERVTEEERINLSRELHDHFGQNLTGLKMDIAFLAKKIEKMSPLENEDLLVKTSGMIVLIDELINSVRKISADLRPNVLDYLGLIPAIEWQMEECQKRTDIDCEFKTNVTKVDLGTQVNSSIFRIVQEAFTNIIRHSKASKLEVSIIENPDSIKLEIIDNGIGIKKEDISNISSLGILGMKERTLQFNGTLQLGNAPKGGTLFTLLVPKRSEK